MWAWLHHILDPHCEECNRCQTCEVLKEQLAAERILNKTLLDKLTQEDVRVEQQVPPVPPSAMPRQIPWRVQRQMLEADDRKAAALKLQKEQELKHIPVVGPNTIDSVEIDELEKEIGIK